ncbi:hypothetical protein E4U42_002913 [Claviceps africana]|uniref:DNA (cytosine-5-)-methyltransferase n=1 Tax=Claviceps africana TaxID=83212 RepID=A0A8K0NJ90_9HYPO|nr:hypothetical protein E4U42_002913 [Claviceps africana]
MSMSFIVAVKHQSEHVLLDDVDAPLSSSYDAVSKREIADVADDAGSVATSSATLEEWSDTKADDEWSDSTCSRLTVDIPDSHTTSPRSCYVPFTPCATEKKEAEALAILQQVLEKTQPQTDLDFIELSLKDFSVYYDTPLYPCAMRCLHHLDTKRLHSNFYVDGILSVADTAIFIRHVPISIVPIGNYACLDSHSVRDQIWLQSELCHGSKTLSNIFYKLETPAEEYKRFFEPFAWVADLAKHIIDFMFIMADKKVKVSIYHFRRAFSAWLPTVHGGSIEFAQWFAKRPSDDFRTSVVANIAFIYKEAFSVLGEEETHFHTIWQEVQDFTMYPEQRLIKNARCGLTKDQTIVTDYIYRLFSHLPFGHKLQAVPICAVSESLRDQVISTNHLEHARCLGNMSAEMQPMCSISSPQSIRPGDTISTARDTEYSGSKWKREESNGFTDVDRWFGLVQKVIHDGQRREFEVLWYYRPVDTSCGVMKYPWANELFLSDHCSCLEKHKIQAHEVLAVHKVEFGGNSTTKCEFFCRQIYISQDRKWLTLKEHNLRCPHTSPTAAAKGDDYTPGETYIVRTGEARSEPCELVGRIEGRPKSYQFRRLLRRAEVDAAASRARPNELVYSNQFAVYSSNQMVDKCYVRVFRPDEAIPTPYDRDGVGCFFFMTHEQVEDQDNVLICRPLQELVPTFQQGFDPAAKIPRLRGLDLFCGGGNFGRGLEEGGAVQMKWANDIDAKAIHTYMANLESPGLVSPFLGSVDDLLHQAINGHFSESVPPTDQVDFISGGSPCPGFSNLTNDKTTDKQRKNQSLVAAFASFIDLYRPKFGLLENVPGIVRTKTDREQDVFSQLLCAVVGLGYQAQMVLLDASACGAAQRRTRVFLVIAAPGCRLPARPQQTHSDPPETRQRGFGMLSNGEAFIERSLPAATPFPFVSALQATRGLPRIFDGQTDTCIGFPDHRLSFGMTRLQRTRISLIPKQPWGMNFRKASQTVLTRSQVSLFNSDRDRTRASTSSVIRQNSGAYGRMFPNRLMETIVTKSNPGDGKNGRQLHWDEDRPISIMEARRAQGFPDEEVLLGSPQVQYHIVGNSVARQVALALGVAVREAWVESHFGTETHMVVAAQKVEQTNRGRYADGAEGKTHDGHGESHIVCTKRMLALPTRSEASIRRRSNNNGMPEAGLGSTPTRSRITIPLKRLAADSVALSADGRTE